MNYTHLLSSLLVILAGVYCFITCFRSRSTFNTLLWATYILVMILPALVFFVYPFHTDLFFRLKPLFDQLWVTVGPVCLVVGVWAIIRNWQPGPMAYTLTILSGLSVFVVLRRMELEVLMPVFMAFLMIVTMTLGSFGLLEKRRSALWVIFAAMLLASSMKLSGISGSAGSEDLSRCLEAASVYCLGLAVRFDAARLF